MSMTTYMRAFIPDTDPTYLKHKKVLLACLEAETDLPKQTAEYFGQDYPDEEILEEKLEFELKEGVHYDKWNDDGAEGFEIYMDKIPKEVQKIRFVNSW